MNFRSRDSVQFLTRNQMVSMGLYFLAAVAAYGAASIILSGQTPSLVQFCLAVTGGAVFVAILNSWRKGVYLFLTWLLFEDLARKYLGNNMIIYFAKDFLALVIYFAVYVAHRRGALQWFKPPFGQSLLFFIFWGLLQVFNPSSPHLVIGLMGMKLYFFYVPMLFVGYSLVESEASLRRFFLTNVILADIIGALGIVQSILGHTFLNPAVPAEDLRDLSTLYRVAPLSGVSLYRPTSVFVSDGRFASYMVLSLLLAFGFGGYLLLRSRKDRPLAFLSVAIIVVALVVSGSRGALLWSVGSLIVGGCAFLWGAPGGKSVRLVRIVQRTVVAGGMAIVVLFLLFPDALLSRVAFYSETLSLDSPASELVSRVRDYPMQNFILAFDNSRWPYGYGIGTASLGLQYIARFFGVVPPVRGVENGFGTLVIEMGILGLALWIVMSFAIVRSCWKVVTRLKGTAWFPLAFMMCWFVFLLLFPFTYNAMSSYQNFVLNTYCWLIVGVLFQMPNIALKAMQTDAGSSQTIRH